MVTLRPHCVWTRYWRYTTNGKQKYMINVYRSRYIYSVPETSRQNMVIYRSQNPGFFGAEHRTTGFTVCQVKTKKWGNILLMEEILHHLAYIKPCKYWDIDHINWCRISSFNSITTKKNMSKPPTFAFTKAVCTVCTVCKNMAKLRDNKRHEVKHREHSCHVKHLKCTKSHKPPLITWMSQEVIWYMVSKCVYTTLVSRFQPIY